MTTWAMRRPSRWRASNATSWPGLGSPIPMRPGRETMSEPEPAREADPTSLRGLLSFFDRWRRTPPHAQEAAAEPRTAATGELVSQARAFQDLRVEDVMKPRADIVAIARSCSFSELVA